MDIKDILYAFIIVVIIETIFLFIDKISNRRISEFIRKKLNSENGHFSIGVFTVWTVYYIIPDTVYFMDITFDLKHLVIGALGGLIGVLLFRVKGRK